MTIGWTIILLAIIAWAVVMAVMWLVITVATPYFTS